MRLLLVGDCHGKTPEIEEKEFEAILAVGDICGDSEEARNAMFQSTEKEKAWHEILGKEKSKEIVKQSLKEGKKVLDHLNSFNVPVYIVPGNWDWTGKIYEEWNFINQNKFQEIIDNFENIQNLNQKAARINNHTVIGYGPCSGPEIPQYEDDKPDTESEMEQIEEEYNQNKENLAQLFEKSREPIIFLSHNVPFNTSLDEIRNEESPANGRHYGSIIVRELIQEYQPEYSIAGHMHEGKGDEQIEKTKAINLGLHNTQILDI